MNQKAAQEKIIKMYSGSGWKSIFVKIRFWDAPYDKLEKLIPLKGKIIDLGCGEGFFSNYLALISEDRDILGVELDKNRVKHANKGLKNTKFINADITQKQVPNADVIIIIHVLHHLLSFKDQEILVKKCFEKLNKKGQLIIVEIEPKFSLKYFITWGTDHFLVPWLFEKRFYSPIFFRKSKDWLTLLNKYSKKVEMYTAEEGKPFTHTIFRCYK